jgi:hypothetical protein
LAQQKNAKFKFRLNRIKILPFNGTGSVIQSAPVTIQFSRATADSASGENLSLRAFFINIAAGLAL